MAFSASRFGNPFGFSLTPMVRRLIVANVVLAIIGWILDWLDYGALFHDILALQPAAILSRPWTLLTYMFVHGGFLHLLFNMIGLFFFGPPLEERWGSTDFLRFYLIAGLGGGLLSLLLPASIVVGASGAVLGLLLAYAMAWPDNPIYIYGILPIKAKWLVAAIVALNLFSALAGRGGNVAYLAHLGGLATAFLYLKSPWAPSPYGGIVPSGRRRHRGAWETVREKIRRRSAPPLRAEPGRSSVPEREERTRSQSAERELLADVDRILDKISERGISSLTEPERKRLDEVSRRYRTN